MKRPEIDISDVKAMVDSEDARLLTASESLKHHRDDCVYFLIAGIDIEGNRYDISDQIGYFRRLDTELSVRDLMNAAKSSIDYYYIARFFNLPCIELCLRNEIFGGDLDKSSSLVWTMMSLLKIRFDIKFSIVAASSAPWSSLPLYSDRSVEISHLEVSQGFSRIHISKIDMSGAAEIISREIITFGKLVNENSNFQIAVRAYSFNYMQSDLRLRIANLWSGIESLFSASTETTFRLALYISAVLEEAGEGRYNLFKKLSKLYAIRSKAVHGSVLSDEAMNSCLKETENILRRTLVKYIEVKRVPTVEQINMMLMGVEME